MKQTQILDNIIAILTSLLLGLVPLVFLPFTQDFYYTPKWTMLTTGTVILIILWAGKLVLTNTFSLSFSLGTLVFGTFTIVSAISLFLSSPNNVEAILSPFGLTMFAALALLFLLAGSSLNAKTASAGRYIAYTSAVLFSLVAIYQYFGFGAVLFAQVPYLADPLWNPTGSPLGLIAILTVTLAILITESILHWKKKDYMSAAIYGIINLIVIIALFLTSLRFIPKISTSLLPLDSGWSIMLELMKNPARALAGAGAENFIEAFTTGRPISLNYTPLWNTRLGFNANLPLHLTTIYGLLGTVAFIIFILSLIQTGRWSRNLHVFLVVIAAVFIMPPDISFFIFISLFFYLYSQKHTRTVSFTPPDQLRWVSLFSAMTIVIVSLGFLYFIIRVYQGEYLLFASLQPDALASGKKTYNLQIKAIERNPYLSRYHMLFSQTNHALANAIATNTQATASTSSGELANQDRQAIAQLIQQAIREAKIAVNLSPGNIFMWENLAQLYRRLMGVASGSDEWARAAYQRALQLDPTNPAQRLNLASLYIINQDYELATQMLLSVIAVKRDFANAYYNLAYIAKERQENLKALQLLETTLGFLEANSSDAQKVRTEINDLVAQLTPEERAAYTQSTTSQQTTEQSTLTLPKQEQQTILRPKLELPQESSPPANM